MLEECTNQGLSAQKSCRFDVDTIKCGAQMENTTDSTLVSTVAPPPSVGEVIRKHEKYLWLGILLGLLVIIVNGSLAYCLYFRLRKPRNKTVVYHTVRHPTVKDPLIVKDQLQMEPLPAKQDDPPVTTQGEYTQ